MGRQRKSDGEHPASLLTFGVNAGIVVDIRRSYEADPTSVDSSWADQFDSRPTPGLGVGTEERSQPAAQPVSEEVS